MEVVLVGVVRDDDERCDNDDGRTTHRAHEDLELLHAGGAVPAFNDTNIVYFNIVFTTLTSVLLCIYVCVCLCVCVMVGKIFQK